MNNLTTLIWNGVKRKIREVNIIPVILKSALNFDLQELMCKKATRCYKIVHFYRYLRSSLIFQYVDEITFHLETNNIKCDDKAPPS